MHLLKDVPADTLTESNRYRLHDHVEGAAAAAADDHLVADAAERQVEPLFDASEFVTRRVYVPRRRRDKHEDDDDNNHHDTALIPLTLIHHKDIVLDGTNPTLVIGYGAYGANLEMTFTLEHLSLLSRRWIIALAHVSGGNHMIHDPFFL